MQEVFSYLSRKEKLYTTVQARSYTGITEASEVSVDGLSGVLAMVEKGQKILVVDDIFDRGKTLLAVKNKLIGALAENHLSAQVQFAALYYKPENCIVDMVPDFFYQTFSTDEWIVLPHELMDLTREELAVKGFTPDT